MAKKVTTKKKQTTFSDKKKKIDINNIKGSMFVILCLGVLLIFATYAWFSTSLNVRIKTFNMVVTKNSGLTISFDAINYDTALEISANALLNDLKNTYPNHMSQWATNGLTPVSSNGITNHNSPAFNIFVADGGVKYFKRDKSRGFVTTKQLQETKPKQFSYYIAFDVFLKNETDSPISDNLYLDGDTSVTIGDEENDEMKGLANSVRIGIVKIGSTSLDAPAAIAQNLSCNNNCESIIYEPNSTNHTALSIERAQKYGVNLVDGQKFPTYAFSRAGGPIYVENSVSGSPNLDPNYFTLQNTVTEANFEEPLFDIPNGVTKARIYLWIEGQDIDSLETDSTGADLSISLSLVKDQAGYTEINE